MKRILSKLPAFALILTLTGCDGFDKVFGINNQCYTCTTTVMASNTVLAVKDVCGGTKAMEKYKTENQGKAGTVMYFTTCKQKP